MSREVMSCVLLVVAIFGSACSEDFAPASLIGSGRLLGARVEVVADTRRSTPRPGEDLRVIFLVAAPAATTFRGVFAFCVAAEVATGLGACREAPFVTVELQGDMSSLPQTVFAVPSADLLAGADQLFGVGVFCAGGVPTVDPIRLSGSCSEGRATVTTLNVALDTAGQSNQHPTVSDGVFTLNGMLWDAPTEFVPETCVEAASNTSLPVYRRVRGKNKDEDKALNRLRITMAFQPQDRQWYEVTFLGEEPPVARTVREQLVVSHFATHGEFERLFSVIEGEGDYPAPEVVDWSLPDSIPPPGLHVSVLFAGRDQRGGFDWTARQLCILPEL